MARPDRCSTSFTKEEIEVADFILSRIPVNPTLSMQARSKAFASFYRKILHMKNKVDSPPPPTAESIPV